MSIGRVRVKTCTGVLKSAQDNVVALSINSRGRRRRRAVIRSIRYVETRVRQFRGSS
jgi:hypothetical protein